MGEVTYATYCSDCYVSMDILTKQQGEKMTETQTAWLLFLVSQPGKSTTPRIRLWRFLKGLGAAVIRDGVYLLPYRAALQEALTAQGQGVQSAGGVAYVLTVAPLPETEAQFRALFDRSADYATLLATLTQLRASLATLPEAQVRRQVQQVRREYEALVAIDYFPGLAQTHSAQALAEVEAAAQRRFAPDEPAPSQTDLSPWSARRIAAGAGPPGNASGWIASPAPG